MNIHLLRVPWALLVFLGAFAFYLLTGAYVPYPGDSADFLAAIAWPMQVAGDVSEPLGTVLTALAIRAVPTQAAFWMTALSAALGATIVAALFVAAAEGVRHSTLDLRDVPAAERPRTRLDLAATVLLTGFGAAALGALALPVWAIATRPLPGGAMTALGAVMVALAMSLRRRCAEDYEEMLPPSTRRRVAMGVLFALATYVFCGRPGLLPVSLAGILLGGGILVRQGVERRLTYLPWILLGLIVGALASVGTLGLWNIAMGTSGETPLLAQWAMRLESQTVPQLTGLVSRFEGAAPFAFFALAFVLLLGCFPRIFFNRRATFFGQLVIVALFVTCLCRWPEELWAMMAEPSPLAALGMALVALNVALLAGAWLLAWFDAHTAWSASLTHLTANIAMAVTLGGLALWQGLLNVNDGPGLMARRALAGAWEPLASVLPVTLTAWFDPEPGLAPFLINRAEHGTPLIPVADLTRAHALLTLNGHPYDTRLSEDPVLAALNAAGPLPTRRYLLATDTAHAFREGPLPPDAAATVESVADHVAATRFGRTPIGERATRKLHALAARLLAAQACGTAPGDPEAAARILRHAIAIDPENPGLRLSLAALDGKVPLSKEERLRGVAVAEADPWLRDPSPDRAAAYERLYGPVLTAGFRAAGRLGALHLGDRASVLRQILAAYREAPETLGAQERIIALLHLPEAEAAASLLARDAPSTEELTFFLCAYPWTDAANALFAKHATRLAQNDCLGMLYLNHGRNTRRQQIDRVGSFFARDGHFAYAYFHLTHLLAEGKLDDALDFVSDFIVADRLADAPVLLESLRLRVIDRLLAQDPARALAFLREWLTADPAQPGLWECLLNLPEATEDEMRQCLARYPTHPVATRLFAEALRRQAGDEAADRYLRTL